MKSIKYLVVLACMTLGLASVAKAQIYSSEICYFQDINRDMCYAIKFELDKILVMTSYPNNGRRVQKHLAESVNYFENETVWQVSHDVYAFEYNSQLSTDARESYQPLSRSAYDKKYGKGWTHPASTWVISISKDKSSLISWQTNNSDKNYSIRVSKEDLLPKNVVPDFLNE